MIEIYALAAGHLFAQFLFVLFVQSNTPARPRQIRGPRGPYGPRIRPPYNPLDEEEGPGRFLRADANGALVILDNFQVDLVLPFFKF